MNLRMIQKLLCAILFMAITTSTQCFADEVNYVTISDPFVKKAPVAVPLLMAGNKTMAEKKLSADMCTTLSDLLKFTGYFKIVAPEAFLEEPSVKGIDVNRINFRNWTMIGVELLVTGSVTESGGNVTIDMNLFDTFKERQLLGLRYTTTDKGIRSVARKFGTQIIKKFTGMDGLFNSKIAYLSTATGNKEIYVCDFDGENPVKVTNTKSITLSPAWSSDGEEMAYTSYQKGKPDIFIKNLKSGTVGVLVALAGSNITPCWVPGKKELAASLSFEGGQGIYLLTRQGKIRKRVTNKWSEWGIDVSPSFSPDGEDMAFVSKRSGTPQIYMQNLDSGSVKRLTYQGKYNTSPSWSPNGMKVAYAGLADTRFEIYVVDLKTGEAERLTYDSGDNESPSWSPDGSMIVFSSTREGYSRLYVMTSSGTDQRRLLFSQGEQTNPKWSPNTFTN